ncbi:MAG: hypothetical protein AVDCRST_MAG03-750, partial [uncultured Rubrobacteraceae bacterium]
GEARPQPRPRGHPWRSGVRRPVRLRRFRRGKRSPLRVQLRPDPGGPRPRLTLLRGPLRPLALLPQHPEGLRPPRPERGDLRGGPLHDDLPRQARRGLEKRLCPPGLRRPHSPHRARRRRRAGHRRHRHGPLGLYRGIRAGPLPVLGLRVPRRRRLRHSRPSIEEPLPARRARPAQAAAPPQARPAPALLPRGLQRAARRPPARRRHDHLVPLVGPRMPRRLLVCGGARDRGRFSDGDLRVRGQLAARRAQHDPRRHRRRRGRSRPPVREARRDVLGPRRGADLRYPAGNPLVGDLYRHPWAALGTANARRCALRIRAGV